MPHHDIPARLFRPSVAMALALAAAACVAPRQPTPPPPPPAPVPVASPSPPATTDWRDIPLTPGDWRYTPSATGSAAIFGRGDVAEFVARCDLAARAVVLARSAAPGAVAATIAITTSAGNRALAAAAIPGPPPALAARLAASDGFLDRMAFSRGRFVVAVTGTVRLVIPAWPEFARVVEDCRG